MNKQTRTIIVFFGCLTAVILITAFALTMSIREDSITADNMPHIIQSIEYVKMEKIADDTHAPRVWYFEHEGRECYVASRAGMWCTD